MQAEPERLIPVPAWSEGGFLAHVIQVEIGDARAAGLDNLGATQRAVRVVMVIRPDLSASDAFKLVERIRQ